MATTIARVLAAARAELRHQPTPVRVRATWAGHELVDTTGAHVVWEPRRVLCQYAVAEADLLAGGVGLEPAAGAAPAVPAEGPLGPDVPFAVHTAAGTALDLVVGDGDAGQRAARAAYRLDDPDLAGLVLLDADVVTWRHEDEQVAGHPRDPFHRVDALPSSRTVTVTHDGEVIARSTRAVAVNETGFPLRLYLPRADVLVPLERTATSTLCPYKGEATYWSAPGLDDALVDIAWSYEEPLTEVVPAAGHVCFDDRVVEVTTTP